MKQLFTLSLLILLSSSMGNAQIIEEMTEIGAINEMLTTQQECWNNGDIDGFIKGYWQSEILIFTSAKHKPTYGWKNTLERFRESYPDKYSMGEFKFEILDLKLTSKTTANLYGKWKLIRNNDHPNGLFWLDLEKFDKNWLITKDSSISFEINTAF